MYRKPSVSSKLPQWQRASSPTYHKRHVISRRYRILIIIAICVIAWRQYSHTTVPQKQVQNFSPENSRRQERDETSSSTHLRHDLPPPAVVELRKEKEGLVSSPVAKNAKVDATQEDDAVIASEGESDAQVVAEKVPLGVSSEDEKRDEEPEEDDQTDRIASAPRRISNDPPGDYDKAPPAQVQEASQKLIDQHLMPAVKHVSGDEKDDDAHLPRPGAPPQFPPYSEYVELDEQAEALPDIIQVPFEVATLDVTLEGWEDQWFSDAIFDVATYGQLEEPKIDFVYTWVNGSDDAFLATMLPYEVNSTLNDEEGKWLEAHRLNRYRDWDELRYSIRSVESYASTFRNKIQLLVNAVGDPETAGTATMEEPARISGKQRPLWIKTDDETKEVIEVLSCEEYFDEQRGLPTFNSLTIENQICNTKSDTDRLFALSDDTLLGKPHAASDIYSPLFGPVMGFKTNGYNTMNPPTDLDARRFGEKPFLIYTSWLLNRRFGERKRKGQSHFGHSISRNVTREALTSFPRPSLQSTYQRFRGEVGFQLYSWYATFHYTIERHREVLLWSYIMHRSDVNQDGNLDWEERQHILEDLEEGMALEGRTPAPRWRMFYRMPAALENAGLAPPKVNIDMQWTSLDGPAAIRDIECFEFNVNECLAPGFSTSMSDDKHKNYAFNTASILDRAARQHPKCGDCLLKLLLNRAKKGLSPLLPSANSQQEAREVVIKALKKYQYSIAELDGLFAMVTDAEQVENVLYKKLIQRGQSVGQLCLNDDVATDDETAVADVRKMMQKLLHAMHPKPSAFEEYQVTMEL